MGANAQTTVPTFTAGAVLTAAQQNASARTGVPVFANTTDRDNAFGGAGEKTLAEGQLCYVEGVGLQTYNAAGVWVTWGRVGPGLVFLATASFTTSSSVVLDTAFSSTYRNYKLFVNYTTSGNSAIAMRMRVSSASVSTSTYNQQYLAGDTGTGAARSVNQTLWEIGRRTNGAFNSASEITIYSPNVATPTIHKTSNTNNDASYTSTSAGAGVIIYELAGNQTDSTAFTGFEIIPVAGTITGTYALYGLATS